MRDANAGAHASAKRGVDVLAEGLSKSDLTEWVRGVHASGDGSPRGLVAALGWERVVRHTRAPLLVAVLDRWAVKAGLVRAGGDSDRPTTPPPPESAAKRAIV